MKKRKSLTVKIRFKKNLKESSMRLDGLYTRRGLDGVGLPSKTAHIYLDTSLSPDNKLITLIHELLHLSIDFDSMYNLPKQINITVDQEEKFCNKVSTYALKQLIKLQKSSTCDKNYG